VAVLRVKGRKKSVPFRRYLRARDFLDALKQLKAFGIVNDGLLDWFEETRLIEPVVRVQWPEPIARRWFFDGRHWPEGPLEPVEPDGPRLDAAQALSVSLSRSGLRGEIEDPHPFDDPEASWTQFIDQGGGGAFASRDERRMSVSTQEHPGLRDGSNVEDFYSAWQVLAAIETSEMGLFIRVNTLDDHVMSEVDQSLRDGNRPSGPISISFGPQHAMTELREHRANLDAVVRSVEEGNVAFLRAARGLGGGRIRLDEERAQAYQDGRVAAAREAMERHGASVDDIVRLINFLADRHLHWLEEGRPFFADVYKTFLASSVRLLQLAEGLDFDEIASRVGNDGWRNPKLRMIWPDWAAEKVDRLQLTLRGSFDETGPGRVTTEELAEFARFITEERLEGFLLRLESFEGHALGDESPAPLGGMQADVQGLAVDVEHILRAMGLQGGQLLSLFKIAWRGTEVEQLLRSHQHLARSAALMDDWPNLLRQIDELASQSPAARVAANLILAHRLRGAVHIQLPEDDQFALELLFVRLLKAAVMTFAHVRRALRS
jgi:hypothetical protein